jgi:adenylylsulfate kinase
MWASPPSTPFLSHEEIEVSSSNVYWHKGKLSEADRAEKLGQQGCVVWLTGYSGSGKSTVAREVESLLVLQGKNAAVLDGDNLRFGLNMDARLLAEKARYAEPTAKRFGVGFSEEDRRENIRRVGEVAALFSQNNVIAVTAFISPRRSDRSAARALLPAGRFFEIFCDTPLPLCEKRDPKGLYKKARAGEVSDFTGISAPYEPPELPELVLNTGDETPTQCAERVVNLLREKGIF